MPASYLQMHFAQGAPSPAKMERIIHAVPQEPMLERCVLGFVYDPKAEVYFKDVEDPNTQVIRVYHPDSPEMVTSAIGTVLAHLTVDGFEVDDYQQIVMTF